MHWGLMHWGLLDRRLLDRWLLHRKLLERGLLTEGWLSDLGWLGMELLVRRSRMLHLHLLLLYSCRLVLNDRLWLYLDFFLYSHSGVNHATGGWYGVLILRPLLDLVVCTFYKLVSEVE